MTRTKQTANKRNGKRPPTTNKTGNVRVIAGQWRGRKLPVLMAEGLRPTTDRVKETVFNWLMPYIHGAKCLDCFAGSGSLGIEALSRGAQHCTFIELNKSASQQISSNLQLLKADNSAVENTNVLNWLGSSKPADFEMVFIDPPFRQGMLHEVCQLLELNHFLADDALIYIEVELELEQLLLPPNWTLLKEKIAGQVAYRLYQRQ